jgi:hypothetical protein
MTKARDLAGFASSSVTTTASDGLVLKGDGTTTDVIIKNGANATVATVADGTTTLAATANLTAGGSITATGASVGALAQGAIQVGNSSGVAAPLTIGSNTQLLQSNGTTAAWATVSSNPYTAQSTAATGYITLVGGLIIQWGGIGSVAAQAYSTTSFAIAFPNACLSVTLSTTATGVGGGVSGPYIRRGTISTSQIQVQNCSSQTAGDINYIAIGH